MTIIRITASKPQLSITPTTQCSSKVWIECESDPKRNINNEVEVNIQIENQTDADERYTDDGHHPEICKEVSTKLSGVGDIYKIATPGCQDITEVKKSNGVKSEARICQLSEYRDRPMSTCKTIKRSRSAVDSHKDQVEVRVVVIVSNSDSTIFFRCLN